MSYTQITAHIIDQTVQLANMPLLASGSEGVLQIRCDFCSLWDGYAKAAVFYRNAGEVYHVPLVDNVATVPHEVLANSGHFFFGVLGVADNTRTTEAVRLNVNQGAITTATAEPEDPTPDIYKQLLAAYGLLEARVNNLARLEEGSTTGDAELMDIRVDSWGDEHETAGEAVRMQVLMLQDDYTSQIQGIREQIDQMGGGGGIVNTATGNPLVLRDSADAPLQGLKLYGKNLIDYRKAIPRNMSGETVEIDEENECIYWTGIYYFYIPLPCVIPAGTTLRLSHKSECEANPNNFAKSWHIEYEDGTTTYVDIGDSITIPQNAVKVWIRRAQTDSNDTIKIWDIQLEVGTVVTEYEPYLGGKDVTVKVIGKNLLDVSKDNAIHLSGYGGYTTENGHIIINTESLVVFKMPVTYGLQYTISFEPKSKAEVNIGRVYELSDEPKQYPSDTDVNYIGMPIEKNITALKRHECSYTPTAENVKWVAVGVYTTDPSEIYIQVEVGTAATAFEPYKEAQTLTVSVPNGLGSDGFVCENCSELYTYKPNTTITNDVGAIMEVEYVADTKAYIDNKFAELAAVIVNNT